MEKFIVLLSDQNEAHLQEMYQQVAKSLQGDSSKVVQILPHVLLFEASDLESATRILTKTLSPSDQFLLMQIYWNYRCSAKLDRAKDLQQFFLK